MMFGHTHQHRLGACRFELLALPQIGGEGHDLATIFDLKPFQDDASVEPTRIGKDDLLDAVFFHLLSRTAVRGRA